MREILLCAGEASGDLHAAALAAALHRSLPGVPLSGVGGDRMAEEGVALLEHVERLAVLGVVEVVRHLPRHYALLRALRRRLRDGRVGLLVLLDYPGFNMKLAAAASAARVPVLYYITPKVCAWGAGRLAAMARLVTNAAVILPFEEELLRRHGVDATFVGHPLLDRVGTLPSRTAARRELGLEEGRPTLALFPGSRLQELERHLPDFLEVARVLERRLPHLQVVVSVAPTVRLDHSSCPYPRIRSASFAVLRAADAALCKSGTTTLEAAIAGCPLAVAYRTSRWTYAIARRVVRIPFISLVNVVSGRAVVPEFVQDALRPAELADALEPLLNHGSPRRTAMLEELATVRAALGSPGAADRVAKLALELYR